MIGGVWDVELVDLDLKRVNWDLGLKFCKVWILMSWVCFSLCLMIWVCFVFGGFW